MKSALKKLREGVFAAGRYRGCKGKPATIEEAAVANMEADGAGSILDTEFISESPDFMSLCPVAEDELREFYATTQPTHAMIEKNMGFFENIERGQGVYIGVYDKGKPAEYCFGGYSFD